MSVSLGPFGFAAVQLIFFISCLFTFLLASWFERRTIKAPTPAQKEHPPSQRGLSSLILRSLVISLLVARCSFVLRYLSAYLAQPWQLLNIRDGGFDFWAGLIALLLLIAWQLFRHRQAAYPFVLSSLLGLSCYFVLHIGYNFYLSQTPYLPQMTLINAQGQPIQLVQNYQGQPLVVNLWATWCPPCRREMPLLNEAQTLWPDVAILPINQGEEPSLVSHFLQQENLHFEHLLLDQNSQFSQAIQSFVLPTSLFFNANGFLVDSHIGELSQARLQQGIEKARAATAKPDKPTAQ